MGQFKAPSVHFQLHWIMFNEFMIIHITFPTYFLFKIPSCSLWIFYDSQFPSISLSYLAYYLPFFYSILVRSHTSPSFYLLIHPHPFISHPHSHFMSHSPPSTPSRLLTILSPHISPATDFFLLLLLNHYEPNAPSVVKHDSFWHRADICCTTDDT